MCFALGQELLQSERAGANTEQGLDGDSGTMGHGEGDIDIGTAIGWHQGNQTKERRGLAHRHAWRHCGL
jgi:hypothetical protein